jgi:hypothetical protein
VRAIVVLAALGGCAPDDDTAVFGFIGEVADFSDTGSTLGLFRVTTADPPYVFKLGEGGSVVNMFDIAFDREPPPEALEVTGVGVATVAMLPGLAVVPDGRIDTRELQLVGHSDNHAIIFKAPGASGAPDWTLRFPEGFSCGQCVKVNGAPDEFAPVDCSFVVVERFFGADPCIWF